MEYGYAFMMKEDDTALRDDFNRVLSEMLADGTLAALQKTYIDGVVNGSGPAPVPFDSFDGKTVTVAVTGCLPPMDYVAADGTPAGFNTAILAEIGRRLKVNIKLVQVDSVARALELFSGMVDVVFWTKGMPSETAGMTDAEYAAYAEKEMEGLPELEKALLRAIDAVMSYTESSRMDMPEGTICTIPYYDDYMTEVIRK